MAVKVELFAAFAEYAGTREVVVSFHPGMTNADLWKEILLNYPKLSSIPPLFAVRNEFVRQEALLNDGDTVLVFPPLSGG
jgi:molybdopterin synthase sulfur carrier subunit